MSWRDTGGRSPLPGGILHTPAQPGKILSGPSLPQRNAWTTPPSIDRSSNSYGLLHLAEKLQPPRQPQPAVVPKPVPPPTPRAETRKVSSKTMAAIKGLKLIKASPDRSVRLYSLPLKMGKEVAITVIRLHENRSEWEHQTSWLVHSAPDYVQRAKDLRWKTRVTTVAKSTFKRFSQQPQPAKYYTFTWPWNDSASSQRDARTATANYRGRITWETPVEPQPIHVKEAEAAAAAAPECTAYTSADISKDLKCLGAIGQLNCAWCRTEGPHLGPEPLLRRTASPSVAFHSLSTVWAPPAIGGQSPNWNVWSLYMMGLSQLEGWTDMQVTKLLRQAKNAPGEPLHADASPWDFWKRQNDTWTELYVHAAGPLARAATVRCMRGREMFVSFPVGAELFCPHLDAPCAICPSPRSRSQLDEARPRSGSLHTWPRTPPGSRDSSTHSVDKGNDNAPPGGGVSGCWRQSQRPDASTVPTSLFLRRLDGVDKQKRELENIHRRVCGNNAPFRQPREGNGLDKSILPSPATRQSPLVYPTNIGNSELNTSPEPNRRSGRNRVEFRLPPLILRKEKDGEWRTGASAAGPPDGADGEVVSPIAASHRQTSGRLLAATTKEHDARADQLHRSRTEAGAAAGQVDGADRDQLSTDEGHYVRMGLGSGASTPPASPATAPPAGGRSKPVKISTFLGKNTQLRTITNRYVPRQVRLQRPRLRELPAGCDDYPGFSPKRSAVGKPGLTKS